MSMAVCGWDGWAQGFVQHFDDLPELASPALRHRLHRAVEEDAGPEWVAAAVPVHVAELVVAPELALGAVDVVLPQTQCRSYVPWLEIVPRAFETNDLGNCSLGEAVDDQSRIP
ncbi:hypothetical protein [Streptomyces uncialis]|uniref:hypothetical protein n=1 Tax=Streptomyces uncialis TaxID=1048205 RepID=UPI0015BA5544|nr:hypothetical protein [Streptomyces uncialis]